MTRKADLQRLQKTIKTCASKEDILIRNRKLSEALVNIIYCSNKCDGSVLEAIKKAEKVLEG